MIINIDYQNRLPIYEQISKEIEKYVSLGILKPKEQIPTIRDLASSLGINPNTVKKAYDLLESKGIIISLSTKGTFITEKTKDIINIKKESLITEIKLKIEELEKIGMPREEVFNKIK